MIWLTFSTYWASISLSVSFVIDRECTLLRTSASFSSYRLFLDAWTCEISFKTSYIAFAASGMYLQFQRNYITVCERKQKNNFYPNTVNRNNWAVGIPAQISFSLLLFTRLNFSHYFGFQLDAALLNSILEKWSFLGLLVKSVIKNSIKSGRCLTLTAEAISLISSPIYSFPVPLKGILVLTILTKTPILSCVWLIL